MRLYFVLPIKMKWMVLVYFVMFAYDVYTYMSFGWPTGLAYGSEIVLALINLLVFIYGCKHRLSFRQNMHQKRRKAQFKAQFSEPRPGSGISRHKCYICGRTELSNPELTFRYCSKVHRQQGILSGSSVYTYARIIITCTTFLIH